MVYTNIKKGARGVASSWALSYSRDKKRPGLSGRRNARAHARGGGISLMRTVPKDRAHRCAHSPTGSRFREIAAALSLAYRTPRGTAPAPTYSQRRPGGEGPGLNRTSP